MGKEGKLVIKGWSALLRCNVCGNEQESREYGSWGIDSSTIMYCPSCEKTTNHTVIGQIAETAEPILKVCA